MGASIQRKNPLELDESVADFVKPSAVSGPYDSEGDNTAYQTNQRLVAEKLSELAPGSVKQHAVEDALSYQVSGNVVTLSGPIAQALNSAAVIMAHRAASNQSQAQVTSTAGSTTLVFNGAATQAVQPATPAPAASTVSASTTTVPSPHTMFGWPSDVPLQDLVHVHRVTTTTTVSEDLFYNRTGELVDQHRDHYADQQQDQWVIYNSIDDTRHHSDPFRTLTIRVNGQSGFDQLREELLTVLAQLGPKHTRMLMDLMVREQMRFEAQRQTNSYSYGPRF